MHRKDNVIKPSTVFLLTAITTLSGCMSSQEIASDGAWLLQAVRVILGVVVGVKIIQLTQSVLGAILGVAVGIGIIFEFVALSKTEAAFIIGIIAVIVFVVAIVVYLLREAGVI